MTDLTCPVCGYSELLHRAWDDGNPSDEICPCCGTHFGYDDFAQTAADRAIQQAELRNRWIANGSPWFSKSTTPPPGLSPAAQPASLDDEGNQGFDDSMTYQCPVCGYPKLSEPPRTEDGGSYEICPSCGFEFGVTDDDRGYTYEAWRARWIEAGMPWWSTDIERVPEDWNPEAQLRNLGT